MFGWLTSQIQPRVVMPVVVATLTLVFAPLTCQAQDAQAQDAPRPPYVERFAALFDQHCAVCHGEDLRGSGQGGPLVGIDLVHGNQVDEIARSIADGFSEAGMPAFAGVLPEGSIRSLAIYISEQRTNRPFTDFNIDDDLVIGNEIRTSQVHDFVLATVASGLDPLPYSIAPLPDGRILLVEKNRGLSIIDLDGSQSALIKNTPVAYDDAIRRGVLIFGNGWLHDVALHPDYASNGWIYLAHGDRCSDCNAASIQTKRPVSMTRLIRGRINDGKWVDEQVILAFDKSIYTTMTDMAAGGRIAFDREGFVYLSMGMKGESNFHGVQDMQAPWGKTHRMHDDGRVPSDNPLVDEAGAIKTIWTYGHRSPHGLEVNPQTGELWETEMGPRGGDELNRLQPGHNYGWPLYSKGVDYDGTPVEYGKQLGIELNLEDIEQPIVDLTPSPAISSFVFYQGKAFPEWRNNIIVGSLRATRLYRMVVVDNKVTHTEVLIDSLARIRDVEVDRDGNLLLLLEHAAGGQIVRLKPAS